MAPHPYPSLSLRAALHRLWKRRARTQADGGAAQPATPAPADHPAASAAALPPAIDHLLPPDPGARSSELAGMPADATLFRPF